MARLPVPFTAVLALAVELVGWELLERGVCLVVLETVGGVRVEKA